MIIKKGDSFAVRAKREGEHTFSSMDVESEVGKKIQDATKARVNLSNPDKTIFIEIRDKDAFIFDKKIPGVGGLPYGSQGKVIAPIMDPKLNLFTAAWMVMKRGCEVIFICFNDPSSFDKIIKKLEEYSVRRIKILKIQEYRGIEDIIDEYRAQGLVAGDTILDIKRSPQLLDLDSTLKIPVLRPLLGMDRAQVDELGRKIGI